MRHLDSEDPRKMAIETFDLATQILASIPWRFETVENQKNDEALLADVQKSDCYR